MFHYLKTRKDVIKKYCKKVKIYSVIVGKKPSKANYYVEKPKNVQEIISSLVKASNRLSSSISTLDIRAAALNSKYSNNVKNSSKTGLRPSDSSQASEDGFQYLQSLHPDHNQAEEARCQEKSPSDVC